MLVKNHEHFLFTLFHDADIHLIIEPEIRTYLRKSQLKLLSLISVYDKTGVVFYLTVILLQLYIKCH